MTNHSLAECALLCIVLGFVWCTLSHRLFPKAMDNQPEKYSTEDCKLVVTCKMQNRNATDQLNPHCSKLALLQGFADSPQQDS